MENYEQIVSGIVSSSLLAKIGSRTLLIIKQRTAKGIFLKGSSSGSDRYSTNPFAMPIGGVKRKDVLMKMINGDYSENDVLLYKAKSRGGKLWVVIKKGYKWLREQSRRGSDKVDLRWSGTLMRSLRVLNVDVAKGEIIIGHGDANSEKVAKYHNLLGAGKSKVIRKYLGLEENEILQVVKDL